MRISNHRMLVRDPSRLHLHWACEMPEEDDEGKVPVHLTRRVKEGPDLSSSSRLDPLLIWKMAQIQSWNDVCWYGGTLQIGIKKSGKKERYVGKNQNKVECGRLRSTDCRSTPQIHRIREVSFRRD